MKKYGKVKLSENDNIDILCTWNENIVNRIIDDMTNTTYVKTVRELVSDIPIKPDPYIYCSEECVNAKPSKSKKLLYVSGPIEISAKEAHDLLENLYSNGIGDYLEYINQKTDERFEAVKGLKRKRK